MSKVWCVAWFGSLAPGRPFGRQWCATFRGHRHLPEAGNVKTACGYFVILPVGGENRVPTCLDCRARVARRRK